MLAPMKSLLARLLSAGLVLAGLLSVLYLLALVGWQYYMQVKTGSWAPLPASLAFDDRAYVPDARLLQVLPFLPELPRAPEWSAWILSRLHVAVLPALMGILLVAFGMRITAQRNLIDRHDLRAREDRLRRVRLGQYGDASGAIERREPYIGS